MAANIDPRFVESPVLDYGQVSTANTNRDGTGTLVTIHTAGADGSRIDLIRVKAAVSTTAGIVRLFASTDGGTTKRLLAELGISAVTASASVQTAEAEWVPTAPLVLPASAILYASTHNAEAMNVFVHGGSF